MRDAIEACKTSGTSPPSIGSKDTMATAPANDVGDRSNIEAARGFIEALTGNADSVVTFQTYPDRPDAKAPPQKLHGTLAQHWNHLCEVNATGMGVSVCPNEMDGKGRSRDNLASVRAVWVDDDRGGVTYESLKARLEPSITVRSARGEHNYWLTQNCDATEFRIRQQALAATLGTDPAMADVAKAMRLPGTLNMKGDPVLVKLVQVSGKTYTGQQLSDAFPTQQETKKKQSAETSDEEIAALLAACDVTERFEQAERFISACKPAIEGEGGRKTTLSVLWALKGFAITEDEELVLAERYNDRCSPPWKKIEIGKMLASSPPGGDEEPGSRLRMPKKQTEGEADAGQEVAESRMARFVRYLKKHTEVLLGGPTIRLNGRTGEIVVGGRSLDTASAATKFQMNIGKAVSWRDDKTGKLKTENIPKDAARDAIIEVAKENEFDPVKEYLVGLPAWDGVDRMPRLTKCLNAARPHALHDVFITRTMIGAVKRIYEPGCKYDTMTILHADVGGEGKSTFWASLFGDEFFCDTKLDLKNKDCFQNAAMGWVTEWQEMASMRAVQTREDVKTFLSSRADTYRKPYRSDPGKYKRTYVFVGTSNQSTILEDDGGNRRFWIIPDCRDVDNGYVKTSRDQLWAQAVALYKNDEQCWLTPAEDERHKELLKDHVVVSSWEDALPGVLHELEAAAVETMTVLHGKTPVVVKPTMVVQFTLDQLITKLGGWQAIANTQRGAEMRLGPKLKKLGFKKNDKSVPVRWTRPARAKNGFGRSDFSPLTVQEDEAITAAEEADGRYPDREDNETE